MRVFIWVVVLVMAMFGGRAVQAVDTLIKVVPDKAFYHPGEAVRLTVSVSGADGASVEADVRYLSATVATLSVGLENGVANLVWTPPSDSMRGYGVDVRLLDVSGKVIATSGTAFDVLDRWIQAPRYGFLTNFSAGRNDIAQTMAAAAAYHVNGLQYYDWQYRHETLLPPEGMEPYTDVLGRVHSLATVTALIDAAHGRNIASMPYTAIYGASYAFYEQHPDWALFSTGDEPYDFAGFLKIMNPMPGSPWADHLLNEFADVLDKTAFDGIHIDQYGAPQHGRNAAGEQVDMEDAFPAFIDAAAQVVQQKRGDEGVTIFNLVRNYPVKTVAPSDEDAVYIEVWEPYRNFMDLPRLVTNAQALGGGKPVIIAAYIDPANVENVRLSNALIFASGAYHLELGEPDAMLADPYFPKFGMMSAELEEIERRYYDFLVRYENVLALGTSDAAERAGALAIAGVETGGRLSADRVAVLVRQGEKGETFSLVNLMGVENGRWNETAHAPTPLSDLAVRVVVDKPVARVWLASPDGDSPQAQAVDFTAADGAITFTVPTLDYWTMVVVEYEA